MTDPEMKKEHTRDCIVQIRGGRIGYKSMSKDLFRNLNVAIRESEIVGICGLSGTGKTTLLKVFAGIHTLNAGSIEWLSSLGCKESSGNRSGENRNVALSLADFEPGCGSIFFAFQDSVESIDQSMSLGDWSTCVLSSANRIDGSDLMIKYLLRLGLCEGLLKKKVNGVSGGEAQRFQIALGLASRPKILLLDEITSMLDPGSIEKVIELIKDVNSTNMICCVLATHDTYFAASLCDRIFVVRDQGLSLEVTDQSPQSYLEEKLRASIFMDAKQTLI